MNTEFQTGDEVLWHSYYGEEYRAVVGGTTKNGRILIALKEPPSYRGARRFRQVKPETLRKLQEKAAGGDV